MSVVKIMGGLGNQLFQYAFGKVLAEKSGQSVSYDTTWFKETHKFPRDFVLNKFSVDASLIFKRPPRVIRDRHDTVSFDKDTFYFGYWQASEYYSDELIEVLRDEFRVKPEYYTDEFLSWRNKIKSQLSVAVHIRRGDYVSLNWHTVPITYYEKALWLMGQLIGAHKIFVFSDDMAWCRNHIHGVEYVDIAEDYLAFELMRDCNHFVIANSTFSWWAARLNPKSVVFAPREWFPVLNTTQVIKARYNSRIIVPNWMTLKNE